MSYFLIRLINTDCLKLLNVIIDASFAFVKLISLFDQKDSKFFSEAINRMFDNILHEVS